MSIPAIEGMGGVAPTGYLSDALEPGAASADGGASFGASLAGAIEGLSARQAYSSGLSVQAVTGELEDVHAYTIAATEAQVALELTAAVRNKAVDAFNEIMRMQA